MLTPQNFNSMKAIAKRVIPALLIITIIMMTSQAQCQVNVMNSSEAQQFLLLPLMMRATQITSAPPSNNTQPTVIVNNILSQNSGMLNSTQVAQVLGMTPEEVARQAGVPVGGSITITQAEQIAASAGKSNLISQLLGMLNSQQNPPPSTGLSVTLPNGVVVPASTLNSLSQLNQTNCMVNGAYINGQAEYIGLIQNANVYYGLSSSPTTTTAQHLFSNSLTAAITLGANGQNIILPYTYEQWIEFFGRFNEYETLGQTLGAMAILSKANTVAETKSILEGKVAAAEKNLGVLTGTGGGARILDDLAQEIENLQQKQEMEGLTDLEKQTLAQDKATFDKIMNDLKMTTTGVPNAPTSEQVNTYNSLASAAALKASSNFILGMYWLGPARFLYQINNALLFQNPSPTGDFYIELQTGPVLTKFLSATNFFGIGDISNAISNTFGVSIPNEAFNVGPTFIINSPTPSQPGTGTTAISSNGQTWQVTTNWVGGSTVTNANKISNTQNYTSLAIQSNTIPPGAVIDTSTQIAKYQSIVSLFALPLFLTMNLPTALGGGGPVSGKIGTMLAQVIPYFGLTQAVFMLKSDYFDDKNLTCDANTLKRYEDWYVGVSATSDFFTIAWPALGVPYLQGITDYLKSLGGIGVIGGKTLAGLNWVSTNKWFSKLSPGTVVQWYLSSFINNYVTNCIDSKYDIIAFQKVPPPNSQAISAARTVTSIANNSVIKNMGLGSLFQGMGQNIQKAALADETTLRVSLTNQNGVVMPTELYYIHLVNADLSWWGKFSSQCFNKCLNSGSISACINGETGVQLHTPKGTVQLAGSTRAKGQDEFDNLGLDLIPNAYIVTELTCTGVFATISNQDLILNNGCPGGACILPSLSQIVGYQVGDLKPVMGNVESILTSNGTIIFASGVPSFNNASNGSSTVLNSLQINGDGSVLGDNNNLGTLETIKFDNGAMWYDSTTGRLVIFIYQLASNLASSFSALNAQASNCTYGNESVPSIKLSVGGNAANAQATQQFNTALNQIQQGCGVEQFETNSTVYTLHNVNGTPTLTVTDKLTGQSSDYPLKSLTQNGSKIVATTPDGKQFTFNIGMGPNGPQVTVTSPSGSTSTDLLTKAAGLGGILAYDPATGKWYVLNGQGIPMSNGFAAGNTIIGGPGGGAVSSPTGDLLGLTPGGSTQTLDILAALPSFTEVEAFAFAGVVFASALIIFTVKKQKS